jgi:hypothetical protein
MRQSVLFALVMVAIAALMFGLPAQTPPVADLPTLSYVTTAHQLGIVGYRDPPGVISPDGKHFAYAEGRFIRVVPIGGGAPITLAPGKGQIRYLAWRSNDTVMAEDTGADNPWWLYGIGSTERRELWGYTAANAFRQFTWKNDGSEIAGLVNRHDGPALVRMPATGSHPQRTPLAGPASFPAFMPDGAVACVADARIMIPCGGKKQTFDPDVDAHGPIAFTANRAYFASPDANGMVALWTADLRTMKAHRVSAFSRDAYAPSIGGDTVVFKTQTYRTFLADVPANGGVTRQLTTFQSETPSYHPTQPRIAFTYGTWRRVVDDAKYPDIAQEIGVVDVSQPLPAAKPSEVLEDSDSEDQAMAWSPNGKWIAFHSHREMSDDIWLRPADGGVPDKRITFLGRGAEVGWPRWSPDGKTVLLDGARKGDGRSVIDAIGVDQESGALTSELREVKAEAFDGDITHAEWLPGSASVIAIAKEAPGRHTIMTLPIAGGRPSIVHRFATEHDFPGLGVSPDGRHVAFVAPAADGYFQIFRMPIAGGDPVQVTTDPSHKTQPAWSPDGARIAFTVWSYEASFWSIK